MVSELVLEKIFKHLLRITSYIILAVPIMLFIVILIKSIPSIKNFGLGFLTGKKWDPVADVYGALPFIVGTLLTSFISLIISLPFSFSMALLLSEYLKDGVISKLLKGAVDLLAGIPSVIYGFWGLYILVPLIHNIELVLGIPPYGVSIIAASIILSIMIIPYSSSLMHETMKIIPGDIKEAAYSLGGTHWEVISKVIIPGSHSGIFAGILLALGRAIGETMAVTMVIGNMNRLNINIFSPGNTVASVIANEFTEAVEELYLSSLIELGLVLFMVTATINYFGRKIIKGFEIENEVRVL